jgi:2'-hydroxyisoflavone reductase
VGDRNNQLDALHGREWDAVIDTSGYVPRHVKDSAELLADHVNQYVFISTISVYKDWDEIGLNEKSAVGVLDDPTIETVDGETYGPLKALCEQAAEAAMPGRTTIVRPGFIVGPGDHSYRFTYWPLRVRQGGAVAVPGAPDDPIQIIDVRDLTEWIIRLAETNTTGVFNGCGPDRVLTMGEIVETARTVTGSDAAFTWLGTGFDEAFPEAAFPIWAPHEGEYKGFHTFDNRRSIAAGLAFRPLSDTIAATLEAFDALPAETRDEAMKRVPVADETAMIEAAR